jgi:hypothetical protein
MTRCDRLFCGEADTGAATVSAMRNYALRGQALLEQATVAASTAYTLNHRVGTRLVKRTTWFECVTADQGYVPGDRLYIDSSAGSGANQTGGAQISLTRNSMNVAIGTGASGIGTIVNKSTPAFGAATVASSWKFGALVERAF